MKKWTKEQEEYLKKIASKKSNKETASMINEKFNTDYTYKAVSSKKKKLNIKSDYKYTPKYTDEIIEFIKENYQGKDNIELANLLNKKFNLDTNSDKVCNLKANIKRRLGLNLRTGINRGCYRKGIEPANKGKKWDEYLSKEQQEKAKKTWFKKGNMPLQHREVGSERINVDGYIEIKVKEPNVWKLKHRYIYEQYYGTIPKGYKVIFLDNDKTNLNINNLKAISSHEELIMNEYKLRYDKQELTKTSHIIAQIELRIRELKNERL